MMKKGICFLLAIGVTAVMAGCGSDEAGLSVSNEGSVNEEAEGLSADEETEDLSADEPVDLDGDGEITMYDIDPVYDVAGERMQGPDPESLNGLEIKFTVEDLDSFVYNGTEYTFPVSPDVFPGDGWEAVSEPAEDNGLSSEDTEVLTDDPTVYMENKDFPGVKMVVYGQDAVTGFDIDISEATGDVPDISVNGFSWSSDLYDTLEVFGEATYAIKTSYDLSYYFEITDAAEETGYSLLLRSVDENKENYGISEIMLYQVDLS